MGAYSMTGFGRGEAQGAQYNLTTEIKSVNHRFKDFRFRMPSLLSSMEVELREMINKNFIRGSFEITINIKKGQDLGASLDLDPRKVEAFLSYMKDLSQRFQMPLSFGPSDLLRNELMNEEDESKKQELQQLLRQSFALAVEEVKQFRQSEGNKLVLIISKHLEMFRENFQEIRANADSYQQEVQERLQKRLEEFGPASEVDSNRLRQEIIYYLEKLDVEEELQRIEVHLEKFGKILQQKGEMGRNIDFLVQELNRETNTIGSKSGKAEISKAVIQMKVQLEKIREQALNLE